VRIGGWTHIGSGAEPTWPIGGSGWSRHRPIGRSGAAGPRRRV